MVKSGEELKAKGIPAGFRPAVAASLANAQTGGGFRVRLRDSGIDTVLRYGNEGRLFGVTFIDHNPRTVLNGSALGKDFAANALAARFPDLATESRENRQPVLPVSIENTQTTAQTPPPKEVSRSTIPAILSDRRFTPIRPVKKKPTRERSM